MKNILELTTLAELEKAAPRVTIPSHEAHQTIVKALGIWASSHKPQVDGAGLTYWRASLAEILSLAAVPELAPKVAGNICRGFCLVMKRENDGFKVAWSEKQLTILKKAFDLA
jgi:hypothetical protein